MESSNSYPAMLYLIRFRASSCLLFVCALLACSAHAQQGVARAVRISDQVEALKGEDATFKPVTLFQRVTPVKATDVLWNAACRQAEVLRFDRAEAQQLIADGTEHITLVIPSADGDVLLDLFRAEALAEDFVLRIASTRQQIATPVSIHFRGAIRGKAGSVVSVSVFPNEVMALLSDNSGQRILGRFDQGPQDLVVFYHEKDLLAQHNMACATSDHSAQELSRNSGGGAPKTLRCVRWYWELEHDIFLDKGSISVAANYGTALFHQSATIFANDGISVALQELFVWDVPSPYLYNSAISALNAFQAQTGTFNGDAGHLLDLNDENGGVTEAIGSLCTSDTDLRLAYSGIETSFNNVPTYSWSVFVVTHEQGHVMGSRHTQACIWNGNNTAIDGCAAPEGQCPPGPIPTDEGGTIMSYCTFLNDVGVNFNNGFGPQPAQVIRDHVNSATCLFACTDTTSCDTVTIALTTAAGANTVLALSVAGVPLVPVAGEEIELCITDGCYIGTLTDQNGDPIDGTYTVTDAGANVIASGSTVVGQFEFTSGTLIQGCTDPAAGNFNAEANCDDGSCCMTYTTLILSDSGGDGWEGAIYAFIDQAGDTVHTGTLEDGSADTLSFCPPAGCYTFVVTAGTDPGEVAWTLGGEAEENGGAEASIAIFLGDPIIGCMDPGACNYDPAAICPGFCVETPVWYADQDGDGFGDPLVAQSACDQPNGFVDNPFDCDDGQAQVFPGAPELCDGLDNNCDGTIDEAFFWFTDADGDGFGDDATLQISCTPVSGAVQQGGDCDDTEPGITAVGQPCDDGDPDTEGDIVREDCTCLGFPINTCPPGEIPDCNGNCAPADWVGDTICDNGAFEHNGNLVFFNCPEFDNDGGDCDGCTTEICDGIDNDCDGEIDEGFVEICNGMDDDCDGIIDEGLVWFDLDGDGSGDPNAPAFCGDPNSVADNTDCDDTDPQVFSTLSLFVFSEDETLDGSAHYVITQGTTVYEGDIDLLAAEFGFGQVQVCLGAGCFTVEVTPNDIALFDECYVTLSNDPGNFEVFDPEDGYSGSETGPLIEICNGIDDDCDGEVDEGCAISLSVRVMLEGPYNSTLGLMGDGLRGMGLVPTVEPYSGLGYPHVSGGGESTTPAVLAQGGGFAVVDWVVLELRSALDPSVIVATRCALLQRLGDVVDVDGHSPVTFIAGPGNYQVAVRHRSHLGVMTLDPVALSTDFTLVDLSVPTTLTFGTNARKSVVGNVPMEVLWAGDVNFNGVLQYTGQDNDRDPILSAIGGVVPTNTITGYHGEDVNMDGTVKYTGEENDRDPILQNIGGVVPTNTQVEQLP